LRKPDKEKYKESFAKKSIDLLESSASPYSNAMFMKDLGYVTKKGYKFIPQNDIGKEFVKKYISRIVSLKKKTSKNKISIKKESEVEKVEVADVEKMIGPIKPEEVASEKVESIDLDYALLDGVELAEADESMDILSHLGGDYLTLDVGEGKAMVKVEGDKFRIMDSNIRSVKNFINKSSESADRRAEDGDDNAMLEVFDVGSSLGGKAIDEISESVAKLIHKNEARVSADDLADAFKNKKG
jgi:hypothetical protein